MIIAWISQLELLRFGESQEFLVMKLRLWAEVV